MLWLLSRWSFRLRPCHQRGSWASVSCLRCSVVLRERREMHGPAMIKRQEDDFPSELGSKKGPRPTLKSHTEHFFVQYRDVLLFMNDPKQPRNHYSRVSGFEKTEAPEQKNGLSLPATEMRLRILVGPRQNAVWPPEQLSKWVPCRCQEINLTRTRSSPRLLRHRQGEFLPQYPGYR